MLLQPSAHYAAAIVTGGFSKILCQRKAKYLLNASLGCQVHKQTCSHHIDPRPSVTTLSPEPQKALPRNTRPQSFLCSTQPVPVKPKSGLASS